MFSSSTNEPVGFTSFSTIDKTYNDQTVQVDAFSQDKLVQSSVTTNHEVQTEENSINTNEAVDFDVEKLKSFLTKATPSVLAELEKIEKSKAFTLHKLSNDENEEVKELYKLSCSDMPISDGMLVSILRWNCTGNIIAVGFGVPYHPKWCTHESAVHFYNISKYKFDGSDPFRITKTNSCVTAMAYHPFEPHLVALGFYNGEISVLNLLKDNEDAQFENDIFHEDKITEILWVTINSQLYIFTSSVDGYVFSYKVSIGLGTLALAERYTFFNNSAAPLPGVSCIAFSPGQRGDFVASLEGGKLIKCSTVVASEIKGGEFISQDVKDPTVKHFKSLTGIVECISFSSVISHLFCVATTEKKCTIHSLNEEGPLLEMWPNFEVTGVVWSWVQANAIFAWGVGSEVLVYDSDTGNQLEKIEPERYGVKGKYIITAALNSKSPKLIAVGAGTHACIWEIPRFFKAKPLQF